MKRLYVSQTHNPQYNPMEFENTEAEWLYVVDKITNSTVPSVLDRLTVDELDVFCVSVDWEVTIK